MYLLHTLLYTFQTKLVKNEMLNETWNKLKTATSKIVHKSQDLFYLYIKTLLQLNLISAFCWVFLKTDEEAADSDDDPEELLAHPDHAANPGEEGQWSYVQLGSGLHHFSVNVYEHSISVRSRVEPWVGCFVPKLLQSDRCWNWFEYTRWIYMMVSSPSSHSYRWLMMIETDQLCQPCLLTSWEVLCTKGWDQQSSMEVHS